MKKEIKILVEGSGRSIKTFIKIIKYWNNFAANNKMYELPELENYKVKLLGEKDSDEEFKEKK